SSVFMKRIRQLTYRQLYADEEHGGKLVANLIYELTPDEKRSADPAWLAATEALQQVARSATAMDTTLWFRADAELPALVACGQFTTCYNLLRRVVRTNPAYASALPAGVAAVFAVARRDWDRFRAEPYFLLHQHPSARPPAAP